MRAFSFLGSMLVLFVALAVVLGLVLVVINIYRDDRKYLEFEEEVYEGQKFENDMPREPFE
jgi:hypothetical protein